MKLRTALFSLLLFALPLSMQAAAVFPATIDLMGTRGEVTQATFTIINTQAVEQTYYLGTMPFKAKDESGEPLFLADSPIDGLSKWIQFSSDHISVPARSQVDVPFTMNIPTDVLAQSYQSAITVSSAPAEVVATNGAIIEAKTAILVFLTVKGDSIKKVALLDFKSATNGFLSTLRESFTFRIQNQGNVYAIPEGTIDFTDVFGRKILSLNANIAKHRILPMTTRSFDVTGEKISGWMNILKDQVQTFAIGPVRATLSLNSGDGFPHIQAEISFWYVPYQLILTSLATIALLLFGYWSISKHKKT